MEFSTSPEVAAFAEEVRAVLEQHYGPAQRDAMHESGTFHDWDLHRALAAKGWIASAVPGGEHVRDPMELATFVTELERADAPYHGLATTLLVAGVIAHCGSEHLRSQVLPRILEGQDIAALGYSEPDHGSDVAAVTTAATPAADGATWTINGQKMWTTMAHIAQHVLLLARTNTAVPKHQGLTMFLVPLDAPGVSIQPIRTMGDERTNVTYYDDVVVSDDLRVGDVDGGWQVMGVALGFERGVLGGCGETAVLLEEVRRWIRDPGSGAGPLCEDPAMLEALATTRIDAEVSWLLSQRAAWIASTGGIPSIEGSMAKLFATQAFQRAAARFQDLAGAEGLLRAGQPGAVAGGAVDRAVRHAPVTTIYGGTTEIQRNNIAERHLGLPRAR